MANILHYCHVNFASQIVDIADKFHPSGILAFREITEAPLKVSFSLNASVS